MSVNKRKASVTYLDIGHVGDNVTIWWWKNRKVKTHKLDPMNEAGHGDVVDSVMDYEGRYDHDTGELSVSITNSRLRHIVDYSQVPKMIVRGLYKKFKPRHVYFFPYDGGGGGVKVGSMGVMRIENYDGDMFSVLKNPTHDQIFKLSDEGRKQLRYGVYGNTLYVWLAKMEIHRWVKYAVAEDKKMIEQGYIERAGGYFTTRARMTNNRSKHKRLRGLHIDLYTYRVASVEEYGGVKVLVNPSPNQAMAWADKDKRLRAVVWQDDLYMWNSYVMTHNEMENFLGVDTYARSIYFDKEKGGYYLWNVKGKERHNKWLKAIIARDNVGCGN